MISEILAPAVSSRRVRVLERPERLAPPMTSSFRNLFKLAFKLFDILEMLLFVYLEFLEYFWPLCL